MVPFYNRKGRSFSNSMSTKTHPVNCTFRERKAVGSAGARKRSCSLNIQLFVCLFVFVCVAKDFSFYLFIFFQVQPTYQAEKILQHTHTHTHMHAHALYIYHSTNYPLCFVLQHLATRECVWKPLCISKFFCERKEPEFHENESSMLSWKPGELINYLIIFVCVCVCVVRDAYIP